MDFLVIEDFDVQCREIISTPSKVAGLRKMVCVLHRNVDNEDEDERDLAAITGSVVAAALGVPALLPFLKEVCEREDSWHARHTGVKTVQQIAVLLGSDVCPHLESLVGIIGYCLNDENEEVQSITPLCLSALAEASALNGFESFDSVFKTLCNCTSLCRGKVLGDFLVAICSLIPLMDATHAACYAKEVMDILIRLIKWNDFQTKETVVKVMSQCLSREGVDADYYRKEILPEFFRNSGGSKPVTC